MNRLQASPGRRRGPRTHLYALLALVTAVVLTACGANVNTQLTLHNDYSGQRQFVLTMEEADADVLEGGVDEAAAVLESQAPDVLTFDGIDSSDEGYRATFTLPFDDVEDYRNNVNVLLDASEVDEADRAMDVAIDENALVTSIRFEEEFYNDDLMAWASDALIDEGVVPSNTTVLTSSGSASVVFDGEDVETSTSLPRIHFSLTDDRRFEEIGMDVAILESGNFTIDLRYLVSPDTTAIHNEYIDERVEQLNDVDGVEGAVQDSGAVENHGGESSEPREVSATFSTAAAVEEGIQILLANEQATFEINELSDADSPDVITEYVGSNWECDAICQPENIQQLDGETMYPDHWELVDQRRGGGEFYVELNRGLPLDSFSSTTGLDFNGDMEQTFEFVVSNETLAGHEDTITELFAPPEGTGTFNTTDRTDTTVFTTTFQAQDADELTSQLTDYLQAKDIADPVAISHDPVTGIWSDYDLQVDLAAIWELVNGGVDETATFQVELPTMHSGDSQSAAESGGTLVMEDSTGTFVVSANGPTMTTVWVAVTTLLLLVLIAAVFFWRRHNTRTTVAGSDSKHDAARPYNVQGPNDPLTETQIFQAPLAPQATQQSTTETPRIRPEATRIYDQTGPFPDLEVPSSSDYQKFASQLGAAEEHGPTAESDEPSAGAPSENRHDDHDRTPNTDAHRSENTAEDRDD